MEENLKKEWTSLCIDVTLYSYQRELAAYC